jgi:amino acid adenylation domain-containing protein
MNHRLSQTQLGIYATCVNSKEEGNYNIPFLYHLPDSVDINRLAKALNAVVEAHPYIKMQLTVADSGEVMAENRDDVPYATPITVVDDIATIEPDFGKTYDLLHAPLFRLEIFKTLHGNYLLVEFHHLIFDGMSKEAFNRDLAAAYAGQPLEREKTTGFEVAEQEAELRDSELFTTERQWALNEFGTADDVNSLPLADVYGDSNEQFVVKQYALDVDDDALEALCQRTGVRLGVMLTTALGFTLAKFNGDDRVLYSTVYHGRNDHALRNLYSMMVKTLPVYHDLRKLDTVDQLLTSSAQQLKACRALRAYSFSDFNADLNFTSDVCMAYQGSFHDFSIELDGMKVPAKDLRRHTLGITFNVQIVDRDGRHVVEIEYPTNKYSDDYLTRFCKAYNNVLREFAVKNNLADIELCDAADLAELDGFNGSADIDLPDGKTVVDLFREAVDRYPDNLAAVYKDKKYTYRELDIITDRLAAYIHANIPADVEEPVVSVLIPRCEYMFIVSLAALKAGCAYQPLDAAYPQERLYFMVKDANASLLVADESLRDIVNEYTGKVLLTSDIPTIMADESLTAPECRLTPASLFILLYTSGTTGVPKGVMLEHRNIVAFCHWYKKYFNLLPEHNVAAYASYGFDANMMDTYPTLTLGATLHIIPEEIRLNLIELNNYFEENHITHSLMTTQVGVQFLLNAGNKSLHHLVVGGEKLVSVDPSPDYALHNAYGPTECTVLSTIKKVEKREENIPIGHSIDTLACYVMDKNQHRLPVGAVGELVICGRQVARGYLNRPDKTAEAFFSINGRRAYHSGDIVRYRADGDVEFVGRKDGQVKIRGFRVELKEVEAVIREFAGINDVSVQAFDEPTGGKFIAAYVVADGEVDIDALNRFILDRKPPYMVPAVTIQIEKIPLNVNQKVDKKALPKPELGAGRKHGEAADVPMNVLETELKEIIASVINTNDFSVTDLLGFMGLTSIASIRLATLIFKRYGVTVDSKGLVAGSLQDIENEILGSLLHKEPDVEAVETEVQAVADNEAMSLTYPQQGVYFDCVKNPESVMYNVPFMYTFPASVAVDRLVDAVKATVANHQSFSLIFTTKNGEPVQILKEDMSIEVAVKAMTPDELTAYQETFVRPFNLQRGPLFRFEVVTTADGVNLLIDCHHLVTDGGSFDLIMREIVNRLQGTDVEAETYSYMQFAANQKRDHEGQQFADAKAFFHSQLQACEGASEITADKPKQENAVSTLGHCSYPVPFAPVDALAKSLGITPASVYLAALFYTVSRYVNDKHVYLGTISNGRGDLRVYNTTGMFVNTLAMGSEIADQTVKDYILETATAFNETLKHEQYPFAQISADYGFRPEIVYEYQVGVISDYTVNGTPLQQHPLQLDLAKFKMKVAVFDTPDGNHEISVGYDESLYSAHLAAEFAESIAAVLAHFVEQPAALLKHVSIMSERQRREVEKFYTTATAEVPYKRFYEAIEHYAATEPDKTALIACDRSLTYAQLNAEANRVAHALMARGVQRGDRVVLLLPRRSDVFCCIYGVSKAGAAYIPCDPDYPADRIALITEDSGAGYVITTDEHMAEHGDKAINVRELLSADVALTNPNVDVDPDDLVYLIYTSGSTGRPKGVMLRHCAICNYLYPHPANIHIHSLLTDKVKAYLSITTLSFDMSLKEYGAALHNGVTLVLANEDEVNNPMLLADLFARTGAEVINGTPSRLVSYMELPAFCEALSKCKSVWSGGEKYSDKLLKRLQSMNLRIFNTYGPTEITVSCNGSELTHRATVAVGRPLLNYQEFIVDSDGNELPIGVVGELYIGGMGVAKGYNNLPQQTAEHFITYHPRSFAPVRVYKSGDYARWLPDGEVDILGRTDNQVKLRGLRIELGEVESAMSKVAGIKQAVVVIRTINGKEHLSAYFTADCKIDIEQMKTEIGKTLTHYMVPTAYLQMEHFPLTPNGKTDLKHLPEPEIAMTGGDYVAPKGKVETDFCNIFSSVLDVERVGAADSFFDLGGTSLTVTRVIIEASAMGYDVAYADVFKNATPQALAKLVAGSDAGVANDEYADPEITDFDYTTIDALLQQNTLDNFRNGKRLELGNVLLTGASGYLGIHVLHELLEEPQSDRQIYCLVRHGREGLSSEDRLKNLLFYYFEHSYGELIGTRLHVIDGDVTNEHVFDSVGPVDTVINCAAIVKHFSDGTEIEDINIGGLQNCVNFCLRSGAHLVQTSTFSISGQSVNGYPNPTTNFSEQMLYFGQMLSSKYTHSKFIAERILLDAVATKGLVGKIVRLGNLAPRAIDGEFQINFGSNSAMGRLHVFQLLGACSYAQSLSQMEFSPIDEVARAILLLATTPQQCVVFHPFNNHVQLLGDVVREMASTLGVTIEEVEEDEFQKRVQDAGADPQKAQILQSMLAYKTSGKDTILGFPKYNPYTCAVLARLGFHWNATSWDYVNRFIQAIASLDFFEARRW